VTRECRIAQEDRRNIQLRMNEMQAENEELRKRADGRSSDSDTIERELRKLQEKHRETMAMLYQLQTAKDHLEASIRVA
jgi:predicted nuclease with TOPRIM domain